MGRVREDLRQEVCSVKSRDASACGTLPRPLHARRPGHRRSQACEPHRRSAAHHTPPSARAQPPPAL
eukprot:7385193-Prymnesium_polylepis.1